MSYNSLLFIAFVVLCLIAYSITPQKGRRYVVLISSTIFYGLCGVRYIPYFLVVTVATWYLARKMTRSYRETDDEISLMSDKLQIKEAKNAVKKRNKRYMRISLTIVLALIIVSKYFAFIIKNINVVGNQLGLQSITAWNIIVPVGISFYSFMAIGYVLDIYWRRYDAEESLITYAAFITFFPHILQGPIDRYNKIKPQIEAAARPTYKDLTYGAQLIIWGFFKKIVIADRLGIFVSNIYDNYNEYYGLILVIATVLYSVQIYADFSGCIDIVSGASEMFGIKLSKNFNHPYFSKSMPEFWRRWHMSLMEWFKDYLYLPVAQSGWMKRIKKGLRKSGHLKIENIAVSCIPILVIWITTGIWHGASWKYVAWGLFHASLIIGGIIFENPIKKLTMALKIQTETFGFRLFQMSRTFVLCCIGRVFFRAGSFMDSLKFFRNTFKGVGLYYILEDQIYNYGIDRANFQFALISIVILWAVSMLQERMCIRDALARQNIVFRWIVFYIAIFSVIIFGIYGPAYNASAFIYGQF